MMLDESQDELPIELGRELSLDKLVVLRTALRPADASQQQVRFRRPSKLRTRGCSGE
jgi:hypothetical protein